ncbi:SDR family NAD(P)-dependent oxidoreductase [Paraferrimonas sedimenticola]|uniref:3-oxoacyl-ACP reductase n=1 Tax=Paraferrimonas sedimenticola TaxID=375674 RepID=A0AA37VS51_9GAMM|nr:SDR family NAD(P)-dependent oxidoreductase [Paraferrimonas sedimenticola]GLP94734.1 3-oxoacyl-ACP reductase [Paraferrimonas sedimenticola]
MRFDGQTAIVTGAARGLGRAYALALAERGAKVALIDNGCDADGQGESDEALQEVASLIHHLGGEAMTFVVDVADEMDIDGTVKFVVEQWGRLDIVVCSAGYQMHKSLIDTSHSEWQRMFSVEVDSVFHLAKRAWPLFQAQGGGRIIVATSATGFYGEAGHVPHSSAKMALYGMVNSLAREGEADNIRVNSLCPVANTRLTQEHYKPELKQIAQPQRVTPGLVLLASDSAPNGKHLLVAGGQFSLAQVYESKGVLLDEEEANPETLLRNWPSLEQSAPLKPYRSVTDYLVQLTQRLKKASKPLLFG